MITSRRLEKSRRPLDQLDFLVTNVRQCDNSKGRSSLYWRTHDPTAV